MYAYNNSADINNTNAYPIVYNINFVVYIRLNKTRIVTGGQETPCPPHLCDTLKVINRGKRQLQNSSGAVHNIYQ